MKTTLQYICSGFIALLFSAFWAVGFSQPPLTLTSNGTVSNYIRLQWNQIPVSLVYGTYGYTLFQWNDALGDWQSTSVKCDDTIQVLNVYPNAAGSNTLKTWMDEPAIGFGKILVTPVTQANFNNNPDSYLRNGSGEYIYDVIMFGSWDANNHVDINPASTTAVRTFLDARRGVLFGHDTQSYLFSNFASLQDKTNLEIVNYSTTYLERGSDTVKVINDGFLLKYPHFIPYNANLTVPYTHTAGQIAKGIVWMNFPTASGSHLAPETIVNGGTNNYYLTTWNNAAMIQTGHSLTRGIPATTDEKKIIANTLWYLAQFTEDTTADICSAPDITPPAAPVANWSNICGQITISTRDSGTVYKFYVKAIALSSAGLRDTAVSNHLIVENKSGLRGYFISEDANPNGVPTVTRDTLNNIITPLTTVASDNQIVTYTIQNPTFYIHIQAVDSAGNLSAVTTVKASDLQSVTTYFDTICVNNSYTKHGFNISASELQTAGNFEFRDTIFSLTSCDSIVILNLTVKLFDTLIIYDTTCPNTDYNKHGFNIPASELDTSGTVEFRDTIPNPTGCDSVIVLYLNVIDEKTLTIDAVICDGDTYQENGFNVSDSGTHTLTLQNRFGCDSTVILNLYVAAKDTVSIFDTICDGETYSQSGFNVSKSGIYTQNLQNKFGCDSLVKLNLTVKPTPDIEIVALSDNFCDKDFVEIQILTNGDSFLWNTGSSENPITVTKSGLYAATAFINDCEKTAEYTVEECPCELWLPNVFTPNNDGVNDSFFPVVHSNLASFSMHIYDRWGQIIYKTDSHTPWDGTNNGRFAAAGVYFCVISYSCANAPEKIVNKQGSVTLVR